MMEKAQTEQETLQKKADTMRERPDGAAKEQEDNSKWLSLIKQYADIKELDREMMFIPCGGEISTKHNQILKFSTFHDIITSGAMFNQKFLKCSEFTYIDGRTFSFIVNKTFCDIKRFRIKKQAL